jgi:hypothetical protein
MDGVPRLALAIAGALIGILAPRYRYATLMVFLAGLTFVVLTGLLVAGGAEVWMMIAVLPLSVVGASLLARWLPRLATLLVLALALALAALTVTGGRREGRWLALGVAVVLLLLGTWKPRMGLLVACAAFGASLAWGVGPFVAGLVPWAVTLGVYLVLGGLLLRSLGADPPGPPWAHCLRSSGAAAVVLALSIAALPFFAPVIATTDGGPEAVRVDRLRAEALHGGLVWPLPSEAIAWGETDLPAFENLDALYLGGRADMGLVKLPDSSALRGRFALNVPIHRMRVVKDDREIEMLRRASRATVEALRHSLHLYRDGGYEGAIAEAVRYHSAELGCEGDSFPPIVASGANALDIHYMRNDSPLVEGDVVVTDIGCYVGHYASDYTRTLPVGGRFSTRARALYEALYRAERAAAEACRAGVYYRGRATPDGSKSLDAVARDTLTAHGAPSDFSHGIGHHIGLFVHDALSFRRGRPLEAGMVIMIEPGIYIESEGIGMRIENAYVVHEDGCELITDGIPTDPDALERSMVQAAAS